MIEEKVDLNEIKETKEEVIVDINKKLGELDKEEATKELKRNTINVWQPRTKLGLEVKSGKIKDFDEILEKHKKILEPEIPDMLLNLESDLILIGQAKGKFGGGKRRAWRQTQKKTQEGNVASFSSMAVVGDRNGHVGAGYGKAKETLPAREKAIRKAKLNIIKVKLGFENPEDKFEPHTVPYKVTGKCGSVTITLIPAPRGTGLVVGDECKKLLKLAGIKDVYTKTSGKTKTTFNLIKACINALIKTTKIEVN